jgi:hypothetical protein
MKITQQLSDVSQIAIFILLMSFMHAAHAEALLSYLTDSQYTGPSLEDNVVLMDTDKNGFADVFEVRAFLELKHGKGYEKDLLDKLEASASGKSCSTPFAKELYNDQSTSVHNN